MDQLVEGVLAVGARLAPEDFAGFGGDRGAVPTHGLAVGFHGQLLQVGREAVQVLVVRQHGVGCDLEEVAVPHVQHAEQHDHVLLERGVGEVFVDLMEAVQELFETFRSEHHGEGGADGCVHGVAAANPVPETEGVGRSMPNSATFSRLVETATKCFLMASAFFSSERRLRRRP